MKRFSLRPGVALFLACVAGTPAMQAQTLRVLFLGDNGHHQPARRFAELEPVLERRNIELTYTDRVEDLATETLSKYDGLIVYANITRIEPDQEAALLEFVSGGKGFIPLHCASYCFLNSPKYIALVGAQFQRHGTGTFTTTIVEPEHPVMRGFGGFESWDETYVHHKHNDEHRTVLSYRIEGQAREPWTWARTHGKGRVFYTAWGHDGRTWNHPGFQNLVERGIRWAVGDDPSVVPAFHDPDVEVAFPVPSMAPRPDDLEPFEYVDVGKKIPNYTRSERWGTQGEPFSRMQVPLSPEKSMRRLVVPQGFRAELVVAEPDLGGKPISMNWDERGRLWVCETIDYPNNPQPPGEGNDRIRICEDTDGDGRSDRFTVFAEDLSIPSSLIFSRGGVIVFDGTQTLYLKDTDGDDVADVREVLFGTWSMRDTHGGPSNLQYGLDNWIWAMQGYNASRLLVGGETHTFRQGFLRFKPDASALEFIRSTDNNTWGLGISEEGIVFGSTANRNPSVYMPIPNRYYEAVRGWAKSLRLGTIADTHLFQPITDKVRQVDQHGGYTAGAGHALYTARHYPREYWNRTAFVCGPTGHLVGTFVLRRDGADFESTSPFNLVASDDEWTAPIMAEVGPDGNVWIIDWYNYIVQHNPTPAGFETGRGAAYETDLRDKKHGRIYRIIYGEDTTPSRLSLAEASAQKLVATLRHDNLFWRRHAQRLLVERGEDDVVPALVELIRDRSVDAIGLNTAAIHALWTLHGLGALETDNASGTGAAIAALGHPSAGVRRNAVQVLPPTQASTAAVLHSGVLADSDAQVRLAALLALADLPPVEAAGPAIIAAITAPANRDDRWIADAATCAAARNSLSYLKALARAEGASGELTEITTVVAEHHARGAPVDSIGGLLAALVEAKPGIAEVIVSGLAAGWPRDQAPPLDEKLEAMLSTLVSKLPVQSRPPLIQLASSWGSEKLEQYAAEAAQALAEVAASTSHGEEARLQAARELVSYRASDAEVVDSLLGLVTPQTPPELSEGFLRALEGSTAEGAGELIASRVAGFTPAVRTSAVAVLLSRPEWTRALLDHAEAGDFRLTELPLDQQQRLTSYRDRRIRQRARDLLERGGALPDPDRQKVLEELLPITREEGDAASGKLVYEKVCASCHVHGTLGQRIGPDLTGMAVHPKEEILTNIIDPNRSVEGNFRVYKLITAKGQVLDGMLASESRTAIELFDAEGKKRTVLREDILQLEASSQSLMPVGFEKQISREELRDLLEFLTQHGKFVPLPLDKVATTVSTRGMFNSPQSRAERLVFDDWSPKTVEGVPFRLIDPQGDRVPNIVLLYGPQGRLPPTMPRRVGLPLSSPVKAVHLLGGVSGWGHPFGEEGSVSMIVRLVYADGETEDHELKNGVHFADYIRRVDVPGSKFAFDLNGRQLRYLSVTAKRNEPVERLEFIKGGDRTAPMIMAATLELPGATDSEPK